MTGNVRGYLTAYAVYALALNVTPGPWHQWPKGTLDKWTATHVVWGALGAAYGLPPGTMAALAVGNEVAELGIRKVTGGRALWGERETAANRVLDVAATLAGYSLARGFVQRWRR